MTKPCDKCCSTGFIIGIPWTGIESTTDGQGGVSVPAIPCKKCGGTGWYDPDKLVDGVPMNMIKDKYWDKAQQW